MRKGVVALSFLLFFLLLFSYFYLPSKSMSDLYQKIPEQVRQNSQLLAAYYHSQTGFNGFREYQFALYDPEARKIRVYTFKIVKLLKFIPAMRDDVVGCEASFNYSILATSPQKNSKTSQTATTAENSSTRVKFTGTERLRAFTRQLMKSSKARRTLLT